MVNGVGDLCDACPFDDPDDTDDDGVCDGSDNCVGTENPGQGDADGDGIGDACDLPGSSTVEVIDFEDIPVPEGEEISAGDFASGRLFFDISDDQSNFVNGELPAQTEPLAYNGSTFFLVHGHYDTEQGWLHPEVTIAMDDGLPFDLHEIDITESYVSGGAYDVEIVGVRNGGGEVSTVVALDGIVDGVGAEEDFEKVFFDEQWIDLTSVSLRSLPERTNRSGLWTTSRSVISRSPRCQRCRALRWPAWCCSGSDEGLGATRAGRRRKPGARGA